VLILMTGGAAAVPAGLIAIAAGEVTWAAVVSTTGLVLTMEGVSAAAMGFLGSVANNPSAPPPVMCPPSGSNVNLPVDPSTANTGVLSTEATPDAYGAYSAPPG
jgi:hypothetical protein